MKVSVIFKKVEEYLRDREQVADYFCCNIIECYLRDVPRADQKRALEVIKTSLDGESTLNCWLGKRTSIRLETKCENIDYRITWMREMASAAEVTGD